MLVLHRLTFCQSTCVGWVTELVYELYKNAFDNMQDAKNRVEKFVIQLVIQKNCKNAKTLAVQKTPVG